MGRSPGFKENYSMKKLAIITGASRGIGRSAAIYFAQEGYDVALIARDEKRLNEVGNKISINYNVNTSIFPLDVSDKKAVDEAIAYILCHHDQIDVLFNNAGILHRGTSEITHDDFNEMIDVNLRGVYHLVHAVVPTMKAQKSGYIFNMSSNSGKRPLGRSGAYCMSKYGVVGFSQSLSLELAPFNIKVTVICPSVINTDMTSDFPDFPNEEKITCEDILDTIDYLIKLGANAYVDEITIKSTYLVRNKQ